ncbi:hypothetical protein NY406_07125 [Chlorobaculum sp. MV4-Y]|uniref:hypothetical protein n=1 Tax=Chlorobaculum sp. MV4-Y TaxID=2976335 RepID=UPI0021AEFCD0|nr:hypothetical protein [Chlorobaculum sp. MV4-Y]UWX57002.1 hypothetical protein NY406_07125 [Chlorobaculum sp. MV4-Y]
MEERFEGVGKLVRKLRAELWFHFWLKGAFARPGATVDRNPARVQKNDRVIYRFDDENEFSVEIKGAINRVDNHFKDKIRKKRSIAMGMLPIISANRFVSKS